MESSMTFNIKQLDALSGDLSRGAVREREQSGRKFSYIEGWWAEAEANRIFGFDAWDTETVYERCVSESARKVGKQQRDGWSVSYICKVRVTVRTPDGAAVVREGVGAGHGIDADLGLAHESALKEAATDAEKRALKTFGNPFGLALYDKTQAHVSDGRTPTLASSSDGTSSRKSSAQAKRDGDHERYTGEIDKLDDAGVVDWLQHFDEYTATAPLSWLQPLKDRLQLRHEELIGASKVADAEAEMDANFHSSLGLQTGTELARNNGAGRAEARA
jgi:hypothetical protein